MRQKRKLLAAGTVMLTSLLAASLSVFAASENGAQSNEGTVYPIVSYAAQEISQPWGLAEAESGSIIIVSSGSNQIVQWQNGQLASLTGQTKTGYFDGVLSDAVFDQPTFTAVDSNGIVYVSDTENHVIRKIVDGKVFTLAGNGKAGYADGKFGSVQFHSPAGIAIDAYDNVYVADTLNHVIRKITPDGRASTFAGNVSVQDIGGYKDGGASEAVFNEPTGLAFDEKGGLYVADSGNHLIRYVYEETVTTAAGRVTETDALTGYMEGGYVNGKQENARFNRPRGLAYADGVLFVADSLNNRIRALKPDGGVISIAGQSAPGDTAGSAETAQFNQPSAVLYADEQLYIADTLNNSVKVLGVDPTALQAIRTPQDLLEGTELLSAEENIQVWMDGKQVNLSEGMEPYMIDDDSMYIPVRAVFEAWGADIKWNASAKAAVLSKDAWMLELSPNQQRSVILQKGVMYVEASYLSDAASFLLAFDNDFNAVVISSGQE